MSFVYNEYIDMQRNLQLEIYKIRFMILYNERIYDVINEDYYC